MRLDWISEQLKPIPMNVGIPVAELVAFSYTIEFMRLAGLLFPPIMQP